VAAYQTVNDGSPISVEEAMSQKRATSLGDISEAIGELKAKVENVEKSSDRAEESRRDIHGKLELMAIEMVRINNSVKSVTTEVSEIKPIVDDYQKIRQNINGGLVVICGVGAVLFTAIGFIMKDFAEWFSTHVRPGLVK
jgi:methyl-accepting chemotaxis protein